MEEKMELNLVELENVSGGMIPVKDGLALLKTSSGNYDTYYEFMNQAEKYFSELSPSLHMSNRQAQTMCLDYVYPKMVTFCRSNPLLSYLTETDIYNLVELFARDIYGRYCKHNWVY